MYISPKGCIYPRGLYILVMISGGSEVVLLVPEGLVRGNLQGSQSGILKEVAGSQKLGFSLKVSEVDSEEVSRVKTVLRLPNQVQAIISNR